MPLVRITPKLKTESAEVYEFEGRHLAIVRTDPDISMDALANAQETLVEFLKMDVLVVNFECDIELVEAPPPTCLERVAADD